MQPSGCEFTREDGKVKLAASARVAHAAVATALWAVSITRKAVEMNRPQAGGYWTYEIALKKAPARFLTGALDFSGNDYGFVVVVVVVSSCLTVTGWAKTTFRTTTRSPTVV
jgi:hypothetical protein